MCALYSRKNDCTRSADQSSGVGDTAKYVGSERGLQRTGRVAVGHGHAAVDLRHHDDLDRVVVDRDEVLRAHELRGRRHRVDAQADDRLVVDVALGGQPVEHPAYPAVGVTGVEPRGRLGDRLLDALEVGLGAGEHRVGVARGVQGEGELARRTSRLPAAGRRRSRRAVTAASRGARRVRRRRRPGPARPRCAAPAPRRARARARWRAASGCR